TVPNHSSAKSSGARSVHKNLHLSSLLHVRESEKPTFREPHRGLTGQNGLRRASRETPKTLSEETYACIGRKSIKFGSRHRRRNGKAPRHRLPAVQPGRYPHVPVACAQRFESIGPPCPHPAACAARRHHEQHGNRRRLDL